jgi:hypothetical protein
MTNLLSNQVFCRLCDHSRYRTLLLLNNLHQGDEVLAPLVLGYWNQELEDVRKDRKIYRVAWRAC